MMKNETYLLRYRSGQITIDRLWICGFSKQLRLAPRAKRCMPTRPDQHLFPNLKRSLGLHDNLGCMFEFTEIVSSTHPSPKQRVEKSIHDDPSITL